MLQLDQIRSCLAVMTVGVCMALAGPAASKSVYAWETEDGVSAYTDDEKQIPKRYKGIAKRQTLRHLKTYSRFTPSGRKVSGSHAERVRTRLAELRESARTSAPTYGHHRGMGLGVQVSGRDRGAVGLRLGRYGGGEPYVVNDLRVRVGSEIATRHAIVVSQGDRVLSTTLGERNVSNISDIPRLKAGFRP